MKRIAALPPLSFALASLVSACGGATQDAAPDAGGAMADGGGGAGTDLDPGSKPAARLYVDDDAPAGGDGRSWATAFTELGDALEAVEAAGASEIWVAAGTYTPTHVPTALLERYDRTENPDCSCAQTSNGDFSDPRWRTFTLREGVAVYGGFAGHETSLEERDWVANPTILSGDFAGDDCFTSGTCADPIDLSCAGAGGSVESGET